MKCKDCIYCEFLERNGDPNRYYCTHPVAAEMACAWAKMICRTARGSAEMTIKRTPRWCPLKRAAGEIR